jgi:sugar/nucleoside kinase (ribokinase family)/fructoselysine-6-P-deglycase FrlB-like protein
VTEQPSASTGDRPTPSPVPLVVVIGNLTIDDVVLPDGTTHMASLGGNSVHTATAVLAGGARAALVARRGEDFPSTAVTALADHGVDVSGMVDVPGPTVRNWVVYEHDGSRTWLYRTPRERSAEVAPRPEDLDAALLGDAAVVHVAAMPLASAEALVARVRDLAPTAVLTLDTHEDWTAAEAARVLRLAAQVDVFVPSLEEVTELTGARDGIRGLRALSAAGLGRVVLKAGEEGAYCLDSGVACLVPALGTTVVDTTGAGDAFCGGLAAGLARGVGLVAATALGGAVAATAIAATGSLRLLDERVDRAAIAAAADGLAANSEPVDLSGAGATVGPSGQPGDVGSYDVDVMRREIAMIPDVVADVLDDRGGRVRAVAQWLADHGVGHLWLTGCGDSAFAGTAAALAFHRHAGVVPHPVHALDLARYDVRYLPAGSAVVALSFSGQVGRTTEAARQARRFGVPVVGLTNAPDGPLGSSADTVLPLEVATLGFSPGTSTYVAMVTTLLTLAAELERLDGHGDGLRTALAHLPKQVAATLDACSDIVPDVARLLQPASWVAFLGAGPNEATARFGAAKLFEGPQRLGVATNLEEWAHEEYFVTSPADPVVLVNPTGAAHDRGQEILDELRFVGAQPVVVADRAPQGTAVPTEVFLPIAPDLPEELSPVTACLPLALLGFHLARLDGKESYNFPSDEARVEHYETIHRATMGEPA